jgi:hypothetical protein
VALTAIRVAKTLLAHAAHARKKFFRTLNGLARLDLVRRELLGEVFFADLLFDLAKPSGISSIPEDDDASFNGRLLPWPGVVFCVAL